MKTFINITLKHCTTFSIIFLSQLSLALAAPKPVKLRVPQALVGSTSSILASNGTSSATTQITTKSVSVKMPSSAASLYLIKNGQVESLIAVADCSKKTAKCKNNKAKIAIKAGKNLGALKSKQSGAVLLANSDAIKLASAASGAKIALTTLAATINSHGRSVSELSIKRRRLNILAEQDADNDFLPDAIDADDDGDGTIDNYDSDTPPSSGSDLTSVRVFSNLKVAIERSLNANTGSTPSSSEIDALLSEIGTLAIQVAGDPGAGESTELNCNGLNYCSSGGTGRTLEGSLSFPDALDSDSDGHGTITAGGTGDFQLAHGASSSEISAGDTFVQIVTDSAANQNEIPGILNFTFITSPALKSLSFNGGSTSTVSYPVSENMPGSTNNCFVAPSGWDGVMTLVGWRPQRQGDSSLAESSFMDIGKSLITIDIPNQPCSSGTSGGCSGSGPGNCSASSYSIPTGETNLTVGSDSLNDAFSDSTADAANTFSFELNLTTCLGSSTLSSGQKVFLDLQVRSRDGDNAAVKFCVQKP